MFVSDLYSFDANEVVEMFTTNGGFKGYKKAGAFLSNKRVGYYWLDDKKRDVQHAFFTEIDSLKYVDQSNSVMNASVIHVYHNKGDHLKVFIDGGKEFDQKFYKLLKANVNE